MSSSRSTNPKSTLASSPISPLLQPTTTTSSSSRSLSGELPRHNPPPPSHRRSHSATSSPSPSLPTGNICPSGRISPTTSSASNSPAVLRSSATTASYGHGSVVPRRHPPSDHHHHPRRPPGGGNDPEELRRAGNDLYRKGCFAEALEIYGLAVEACPRSAACRSNRAAALAALGRVAEAAAECAEAVRVDPSYGRAHHRLAILYLRLGQVDNARKHLHSTSEQPDQMELQKLQSIERHLSRSMDARRIGDWKSVLQETEAAIAAGADSSTLLIALQAEALLRLYRLDEADSNLSKMTKLGSPINLISNTRVFGMQVDTYLYLVRAQVDMTLGRFEDAESSARKASELDPGNKEVVNVANNTRSVGRARACGNEMFNSGKFLDACNAYAEGLAFDPSNPVLYCNRAVCQSKLGLWEKSIADCNEALRIQPSYTKALLRRAASYAKLERWAESVRDYEVLGKQLPHDKDIREALNHARVAWKASHGVEDLNLKSGGEAQKVTTLEHFQAAISLSGISVVCFMSTSNKQSVQSSLFVDSICSKYPSLDFLRVDLDESPSVSKLENVRIVPAFKIYKNGIRIKEMFCPSQQVLEQSLRHYSSI